MTTATERDVLGFVKRRIQVWQAQQAVNVLAIGKATVDGRDTAEMVARYEANEVVIRELQYIADCKWPADDMPVAS